MTTNRLCILLCGLSLLGLSGCAAYAAAPVSGFIYSDLNGPFHGSGDATGTKVGEATCVSYVGIVAVGDCSVQAAKEQGDINTIHYIDYKSTNILGVYATFTLMVYGE